MIMSLGRSGAALVTGLCLVAVCLSQARGQSGGTGSGPLPGATVAPSATPPPPPSRLGPSDAPLEARRELRTLTDQLDRVDRLLLEGRPETAAESLDEAEVKLNEIREKHGPALPPAYVPLFVAEERLAALRRQVTDPAQGSK
jgi:hypothetical protein